MALTNSRNDFVVWLGYSIVKRAIHPNLSDGSVLRLCAKKRSVPEDRDASKLASFFWVNYLEQIVKTGIVFIHEYGLASPLKLLEVNSIYTRKLIFVKTFFNKNYVLRHFLADTISG